MSFFRDIAVIVVAMLVIAAGLLVASYFLGICAGVAHLGYEWAVS